MLDLACPLVGSVIAGMSLSSLLRDTAAACSESSTIITPSSAGRCLPPPPEIDPRSDLGAPAVGPRIRSSMHCTPLQRSTGAVATVAPARNGAGGVAAPVSLCIDAP
eukprot:CAMPEP_0174726534 /NCGR_PEP_ID=MMETSP1094-20130205/47999_1 /TAXON_ID=156173 /ORGANISM="Chrysochromulina brevifilum, Strain UTEX LB 985" /LENGTH=106 /DNA_ID=CAMNT_0015928131 /DNA_START=591 /DNA_END=908 /DNA_ORIENTATION=+